MSCSSHKSTDFIQFNDVYLSVVNCSSESFEVLINEQYRQFNRSDFGLFPTGDMFSLDQRYVIASDEWEDKMYIFDLDKETRVGVHNKSKGLKLAPQYGSHFIWGFDITIWSLFSQKNLTLLQRLTTRGIIMESLQLPISSYDQTDWSSQKVFIWEKDTFVCFLGEQNNRNKSSFIMKIDHLKRNDTVSLASFVSTIEFGYQGSLFFVPSYPKPLIFLQKVSNDLLVYSFVEMLNEMQNAVEKCRKNGQSTERLFRLKDFLHGKRRAPKCTLQDELLIYSYYNIMVEIRFTKSVKNIVWLGHEIQKMKLITTGPGEIFYICDHKENDKKIKCDRNFTVGKLPPFDVRFLDHKRGFFVVITQDTKSVVVQTVLECFEFISCETCTMLGYYNPCIWNGSNCIDRQSGIDQEEYQCFSALISYTKISDDRTEIKVTLPYELKYEYGEEVYLESLTGLRLNVSHSGNEYFASVSSVSEYQNLSINFIRPTGGPMKIVPIPDSPDMDSLPDLIIISILIALISIIPCWYIRYIRTRHRDLTLSTLDVSSSRRVTSSLKISTSSIPSLDSRDSRKSEPPKLLKKY